MGRGAIGILGAGGMARESASYARDRVDFFAVDKAYISAGSENLIDIKNPTDAQKKTPVVAALGAPAVRKSMLEEWPGEEYVSIVSTGATVLSEEIGEGVIIAPGSIITTNVVIGDHSIINIGATISHDCRLGDFVTVCPGAHVAGGVELGNGVFVGIGASVSNNVKIANGVMIGAGAVVVGDVEEENAVVVGVPARTVKINKGWVHEI